MYTIRDGFICKFHFSCIWKFHPLEVFVLAEVMMATIDVDMTCAVCVSRAESVISELDGISNVAVNPAKGSSLVEL